MKTVKQINKRLVLNSASKSISKLHMRKKQPVTEENSRSEGNTEESTVTVCFFIFLYYVNVIDT